MRYLVTGTLGDAYIIVCKLFDRHVEDVIHVTFHKHLHKKIREIYTLLGENVNVKIIDLDETLFRSSDEFKNILNEEQMDEFNPDSLLYVESFIQYTDEIINPNPTLKLCNIDKFNLPEKYIILQLESGATGGQPWRKLDSSNLENINIKLPIVLLGTDEVEIKLDNVIDLRNKTSLVESFSIIKHSEYFYGPQGLLSFVSLSQKVKSTIFLKNEVDSRAVSVRIEKIPEWKKIVKYE